MTVQDSFPAVGDRLPELQVGPITRATLALFAGASHDHTPIHIDIDFVRAMGRDDVIAHGMYVMAGMARLVTRWRSQRDLVALKGRFLDTVRVGDVVIYSGEIAAVHQDGETRVANITLEAATADGRQVMTGQAVVRL